MPTVLLVDDDSTTRTLLTAWLQQMDHQVLVAASAVEALYLLDEHGVPDVAVLDLGMEQIGDLELLHRLRRHDQPCADLPAILLTARRRRTDLDEAWALDGLMMINPIACEQLSAAIGRAVPISV
jgi:CheY-like chemotaxis protein